MNFPEAAKIDVVPAETFLNWPK